MKAYYYFLYRVYWHYRDSPKKGHERALITTSFVSSLILYVILVTIFGLLYFFQKNQAPSFLSNDKLKTIFIMLIIYVINYFLFIKPMRFLKQNLRKDKKGGFLILLFFIILGFLFVIGANKNRDKISKTYDKTRTENNE